MNPLDHDTIPCPQGPADETWPPMTERDTLPSFTAFEETSEIEVTRVLDDNEEIEF